MKQFLLSLSASVDDSYYADSKAIMMATAKFQAEKIDQLLVQQTVFGELLSPDEKQYLMDHSQVRNVAEGEVICRQRQQDNNVFILLLGEVEVTEVQGSQPIVLARLRRGEIFGEIAALLHLPRISTVTASKPAVLLEIPGTSFESLINQRKTLRDAIWQRYHQRLCMTVLRMVGQFRYLPETALASLIETVTLVSYAPGHRVIEAGIPGDALFIVITGEAMVSQDIEGEDKRVALLRAGDYFGEWSLLTGAPCSATVTATTPVSLLCIDRAVFLRFIQDYPSVRDGIDHVAHNRQSQTNCAESAPGPSHSILPLQ